MSDGPDELDQDDAAAGAIGGELISSLDPMLLVTSLAKTIRPDLIVPALGRMMTVLPAVLSGQTAVDIPARDTRFRDEAWRDNPLYHGWAQLYLTFEREMISLLENDDVDWRTRERATLLMGVLTSALAPTNMLVGNPEAIKKAFTTGGKSLLSGATNFVKDLTQNRGFPAQVDTAAFAVGRDVAATPGWVIHRTEMFELIQYTATQPQVGTVPLVLLPPAVNKYYFWDLAPGRSLIEYAVGRGIDVFTIVWRDPTPGGTCAWGIDSYLAAALEAIDVVRDVTETPAVHVFGDCSGGMFLTMLLGHQAATGEKTILTGTHGVTVVDFGEPGGIGVTSSDTALESIRKRAERGEVIAASSISDTFVWMRPNDLVWRYLIDEWLLGNKVPAFDIMFWNADGQGLPAQLALDMTKMSLANSLVEPGEMMALNTPIDLSKVEVDTYHIAGRTDHISPWKGCYAAARVLGGHNEFVLTPTGHVQSIIYPPDKPRAAFFTNSKVHAHPDAWVASATKHEGSWWPHWVDWILERSDGTRAAPAEAGNDRHPPIVPAPGTYVLGK